MSRLDAPCSDLVVQVVSDTPGQAASEVALILEIDRSDAVHLLHEHFGECLFQDNRYRWWPSSADVDEFEADDEASSQAAMVFDGVSHSNLARYYLDAVISDSRGDVSVFARSNDPDYLIVDDRPIADGIFAMPVDGYIDFINDPSKKTKRFSIGTPVYADYATSKNGWSGFFLKPLFTWSVGFGAGVIEVAQSSITINADVLASLSGAKRTNPEEVVSLQTNLGLDRPEELPPFDEVMARLVSLNPSWPWAEPMDPMEPGFEPPLHLLKFRNQAGFYNRVMLTAVEGSSYTRGLETELDTISKQSAASISNTALGRVLAGPKFGTSGLADEYGKDLLEPLPLNAEQRDAVEAALTSDFTVVTGPPGTGKSQVVSAIIVNAAFRGQTVLFASKNNKAVDVVEARIRMLAQRPVLMRLGSRYLGALTDYLTGLLSMPTGSAVKSQYSQAIAQLGVVDARIELVEESIGAVVAARNAVADLDADTETARTVLPAALVSSPDSLDLIEASTTVDEYVVLADTAVRSQQSWFIRTFWFAFRHRREQTFVAAIPKVRVVATTLGLGDLTGLGDPGEAAQQAAAIRERIELLRSLRRFTTEEASLATGERIEDLYERRAELIQDRSEASLVVWDTWVDMLRSEMTPVQQNNLGKLRAVAAALAAGPWTSVLANRFQTLLASVKRFLPCWAITSLSLRGRVPLEPGIFDLVVIDEASQCDIASAFPLLYRAKRAVIIGDPEQLRHISGLSRTEDQSIRGNYGMSDLVEWSYVTNSLYDLGARVAESTVFLRDHHRSDADVIEFSNREFYSGLLRVATRYDRLVRPDPPTAVRWVQVSGSFDAPGGSGGRNDPEALAVVDELDRLEAQGYRGTVGVVTPFRDQANRIKQLASTQLSPTFMAGAQIDIGTVHTFQGDERDVMIYSPVIAKGAGRGALWFVGEQNKNLFNVAITRARSSLVVVGDRESGEMQSIPTMKRFINYVDSLAPGADQALDEVGDFGERYPDRFKESRVSMWERNLYEELYREGIITTPQVEIDAYRLDLALYDGDRKLDIEIDGEKHHAAWDGNYVYADRLRNMRMLELGWDVMRFWVWEIRDDLDGCVRRVEAWLETTL